MDDEHYLRQPLLQPRRLGATQRIAIQGELGSNSHMAALQVIAAWKNGENSREQLVACSSSAEVFEKLASGAVDLAVLPIENTLHGSVAEHYDLLLTGTACITGETLLRIQHHVLAMPGVRLEDVRRVLSHPVALSQCRQWLRAHPHIEAIPFYDTAGSVKQLMENGLRETAGIAPALSATQYGAQVLVEGVEDHVENYTRFYVLEQAGTVVRGANKMSAAFSVEHRPGTLIDALQEFRQAGLNLTRIESRPVHGKPWEYVFFVDLRFDVEAKVEAAMLGLERHCSMVKQLGRYRAA